MPVEIQIRTTEMHRVSEYGVAAHWMYKEGRNKANLLDTKLAWFRQMLEEQETMSAKELMEKIVKLADSKKAGEITVLQVGEQTTLADYFIVMTGMSTPHLRALSEEIEVKLKEEGVMPHHIEGVTSSWVLMDYSTVVVNIFMEEAREMYALERLWGDAVTVDIEKLLIKE